jgi:hypothetical protein
MSVKTRKAQVMGDGDLVVFHEVALPDLGNDEVETCAAAIPPPSEVRGGPIISVHMRGHSKS